MKKHTRYTVQFLSLILLGLSNLLTAQVTSQEELLRALEAYPDVREQYIQAGSRNGFDVDFNIIEPTCNGDSDGIIYATPVTPGSYAYFWFGTGTTADSLPNVDAGNELVRVTDLITSEICIFNVSVQEPTEIGVFDLNPIPPSCGGTCDGQANPLTAGGTGTLHYAYDSGETTQMATMLCNPFDLTITDDNGCTVDTTFEFINAPDTLKITAVVTDITCSGAMDGTIDTEVTGGTGNIAYDWTVITAPFSNSDDLSDLDALTYDLTVTDDNGCTADTMFTVNDATPIEVTGAAQNILCYGDSTGAINIDVMGGDGNFTFAWTGPDMYTSGDEDITDLKAGTYLLTITDGLNCDKDTSFIIDESGPITFGHMITEVDCFEASTGGIDVSVDGPFDIALYEWSGDIVNNNEDQTMLSAGSYTLTVTDDQGCMADTTFVLVEPEELDLTIDIDEIACAGDATGSIDLTVTGGTGAPTFDWQPIGANTEDLIDVPADTYTVTVTDQANCTAMAQAELVDPSPIQVLDNITHVSCAGGSDGRIIVVIVGGEDPYTLSWDPPAPPIDIPAGHYQLTVTDSFDCVAVFDYEVLEPEPLLFEIAIDSVSCAGMNDGVVEVVVSGGTGTPVISIDPVVDLNNVPAGTYTLSAFDDNDCQIDSIIEVGEPDAMFIDALATDLSCFGANDGSIDVTAGGGNGQYTYVWTGPSITAANMNNEDLSSLDNGLYTLVVTDAKGCEETIDITINEPESIELSALITDIDCSGESSGSIDLTPSLGAGGYTYLWAGPSIIPGDNDTDQDIFDLAQGPYTVIVTDANMCTKDSMFQIVESDPLVVLEDITEITCHGDATGAIAIDVSGGAMGYTYVWTGPGITADNMDDEDLIDLIAGEYTLTVSDALDCSQMVTFTLEQSAPILITLDPVDPFCYEESTGSIDAEANGDFPLFDHAWSGTGGFVPVNGIGLDIMDLPEGDYTLTVTDQMGCMADTTYSLVNPEDLDADLTLMDSGCDLDNGSAQSAVSGGTIAGAYTYTWMQGMTTLGNGPDQGGLGAGSYSFTVSDDNNCSVIIPFELSDDVGAIVATVNDAVCFEDCNGIIDVDITGLTGDLDIIWTGPNGPYTAEDLSGLCAGDYTITVEDELGCDIVETYSIGEPDEIVINPNIIHETCSEANDGAIDITPTGGAGTYTYLWNGPGVINVVTEDISNLSPGDYTVVVTDPSNCTQTATYTVNEATEFTLSAVIIDASCAGDDNGSIDLSISPAPQPGSSIVWSAALDTDYSASTEDISTLAPDTYTVTFTSALSCSVQAEYAVSEPDPIQATPMVTNSVCGQSVGAVSFDITGGTVAADYAVDVYTVPGLIPSPTTGMDGGNYGYTVTDDNACVFTGTFTVSDEFGTLTDDVSDLSCNGAMDGAIDITYSGLTGTPAIVWTHNGDPYASTEDISGLEAGTYTVVITDDNNCVLGDTYTVSEPDPIDITGALLHLDCNSDTDGAIDISYTGVQNGVASFEWTHPVGSPFSNSEDISDLEGGLYTILITDNEGCEGQRNFTINEPTAITVMESITPVVCNGAQTGAISIITSGGTGTLAPHWTATNPTYESFFEDISGLVANTYTLELTDDNSCTFTDNYIVTENTPISIDTLQFISANCGQDEGLVQVDAFGGNGPYEYEWTNDVPQIISSTATASMLAAGTYMVLVTDDSNCSRSFPFTINNLEAALSAEVTDAECFGEMNGAIDLTIEGDLIDPVTIAWNGPGVSNVGTEDIDNIAAGVYTVNVSDGAGCMYQLIEEVFSADSIEISGITTEISCEGANDGSIDISTNLVDTPDYLWTGPSINTSNEENEDQSNLDGGFYTVTVTTAAGCSNMQSFTVIEPMIIEVDVVINSVSCFGECDGAINITISGGTADYTATWTGPDFGANGQDINGLCAGDYTLLIEDDRGCVFTDTYTVGTPDQISFILIDQAPSSCNSPIGFIEVEAENGTGDFDYIWTNSAGDTVSMVAIASMLPADTYTVEATDDNGCSATESYIISNQDVSLSAELSHITCNGLDNGTIDLTVTGNLALVDTSWTGPGGPYFTEDITGLMAGEYIVVLQDALGCTFSESYTLTEPDTILVTGMTTGVDCFGDEGGAITIDQPTGGTGTLDIQWTNPEDEDIAGELVITDVVNGIYTVTVTDQADCEVSYEFEVEAPEPIVVVSDSDDPTCIGLADGSISNAITGGTVAGDYVLSWTGPDGPHMGEDLTGLAGGTYQLVITDDNLCTDTQTYVLAGIQAIGFSMLIDSIDCFGGTDAAIDITDDIANGATYTWEQNDVFYSNDPDISNLGPAVYDLQITDPQGCQLDTSIVVIEPVELAIVLESLVNPNCNGDGNGAIDISPEGGTSGYDYGWAGPGGPYTTQDISPLSDGTYVLTLTDANDCVAQASFDINEPEILAINLESITDAQCENTPNGSIDITVTGGTTDYTIEWQGPGFTDDVEDADELLPGVYEVTVLDANSCLASSSYIVDYQIEISAEAGLYPDICNGELVTLTGQGSPSTSDFDWSIPGGQFPFATTPNVDVNPQDNNNAFVLTVTNGDCVARDTTYIGILPLPNPDAGEDSELYLDEAAELGGDPTWQTATSYSWTPAGLLDDPNSANPVFIVSGSEIFTVSVVDMNGCIGTDQVTIILNPSVEVPGGFTPNGDQQNDDWEIQNSALFPEMTARVYSRWGDELWSSGIGYPEPWDGKYDGKDIPVGTYYFIIELNDERFPDPITGPLTIFR